jgi:hypothetical protein
MYYFSGLTVCAFSDQFKCLMLFVVDVFLLLACGHWPTDSDLSLVFYVYNVCYLCNTKKKIVLEIEIERGQFALGKAYLYNALYRY